MPMTWLLASLLASVETPTKLRGAPAEIIHVSARLIRAAEGSKRSQSLQRSERVRRFIERAPGGEDVEVIVIDFE